MVKLMTLKDLVYLHSVEYVVLRRVVIFFYESIWGLRGKKDDCLAMTNTTHDYVILLSLEYHS